jgi:hypothetical protein
MAIAAHLPAPQAFESTAHGANSRAYLPKLAGTVVLAGRAVHEPAPAPTSALAASAGAAAATTSPAPAAGAAADPATPDVTAEAPGGPAADSTELTELRELLQVGRC